MPTVAKKKTAPAAEAPKKKVKAAEPEEEEAPAKKKVASKNGKVTTTKKAVAPVATKSKKKKAATSSMSARDVVLKVLVAGAPRAEVKARAKKLAAEEGADVSFKTFDVSFFIKYLTDKKGYTLEEKKSGVVKLIAPKKVKA